MRIGYSGMNNPGDPPPDVLGRALEDRGFDSLWFGEHPHIPAERRTPYPAGGELPAPYKQMMDPFLSLLLAASATEHLLVGTGVALPLEHDVFDLAKTVATCDRLTGGRLQLGVGVGWNVEELANHRPGLPWSQRYAALEDCVGALRALWTQDEAEHHGPHVSFDPVWSFPKPLQQPHPPILCGTGGKLGTQHAVRWADGWMPMDLALGDVAKKVTLFRSAASDAGRDPAALPITLVTFGDPDRGVLEDYRALDIERVVLGAGRTGWDDPTTILPFIDTWADVVADLA